MMCFCAICCEAIARKTRTFNEQFGAAMTPSPVFHGFEQHVDGAVSLTQQPSAEPVENVGAREAFILHQAGALQCLDRAVVMQSASS